MDQTCDPGSGWKIERPTTDLDKVDTVRNFSDNSSIQSVQAPGPARLGTVFYILFNAFIDREKLHQSYHSPSISNKTFTICGKIKGCVQRSYVLFDLSLSLLSNAFLWFKI